MKQWLVLGMCAALLVAGCTNEPRFDRYSRARSFDCLWSELGRYYVYPAGRYDYWRDVKARHRPKIVAAHTPREYLIAMSTMLAELADPHVEITNSDEWYEAISGKARVGVGCKFYAVDERVYVSFDGSAEVVEANPPLPPQERYELLSVDGVPAQFGGLTLAGDHPGECITFVLLLSDYSEATLRLRRPPPPPRTDEHVKKEEPLVKSYRDAVGEHSIGYIEIKTFDDETAIAEFDTALDDLMDTDALCLSLWNNSGGFRSVAQAIMGRFVDSTRPYGYNQKLTPRFVPFPFELRKGAYLTPIRDEETVVVNPRGRTYRKPLVVLISSGTASGAEMMAAGLKDIRGATLVGRRTAGACAAIKEMTLPDGLAVQYSYRPFRRLDGRTFQYVGIEPDVYVPFDSAALCRDGDSVIKEWGARVSRRAIEIAVERAGPQAPPPEAAAVPAVQESSP